MPDGILTYREITRDEVAQSAQIVLDAFNQLSEQSGSPKTEDAQPIIARLNEYLDDEGIPGHLYGGFVDGVQVGFFMLRQLGMDEETWEISMLSVSPAHQGKGYGRRLLSCSLQKVLDLKGVLAVCAVTDGNDRMLGMLAREGFVCEASGVPVGPDLSIWMLRKDMKNASCASDSCSSCSSGCDSCAGCSDESL